jgi:hypothetical protein
MPELFPLVRKVDFIGAYDLSPKYGIHNMVIMFVVSGARGAVSITMSTGWYLPAQQLSHVQRHIKGYPWDPEDLARPNITDVGIHSIKEPYEGAFRRDYCEYCGGPAYCDGTSLWGNEAWREGFLHGGTDWLWPRLEEYYNHRFNDGPLPDLTPIPRKHPDEK